MSQVIPNAKSVADLLAMIFGEDINVVEASGDDFSGNHVATFLNPDDKLVAISACDSQFVTYSGAALSMIPLPVANEMISGNEISDAVKANFYEVMNICSKLMLSDNSPHLRLVDVHAPGEESSSAVAALSSDATTVCFDVDVPRYGHGQIGFVIE